MKIDREAFFRDRQKMMENFDALFEAARNSHRGGVGGARICICGAGSGGSKACNALYTLQAALECDDQWVRDELLLQLGLGTGHKL